MAAVLAVILVASLSGPAAAAVPPAPDTDGAEQTPLQPVHAAFISNSLFYRIKLAVEHIRLWLTRSAKAQTEYLIELIDRRSSEIAEMIRTGRTRLVETAARDQARLIQRAQDRVSDMEMAEEENVGLLGKVEKAVGRAWNTLSTAVSRLPEKARGGVRGIINSLSRRAAEFWEDIEQALSRVHGAEAARKLLERLKPGHESQPAGPPDGKGPAEEGPAEGNGPAGGKGSGEGKGPGEGKGAPAGKGTPGGKGPPVSNGPDGR